MQIKSRVWVSYYITKALIWYQNLSIAFSSHSSYKTLNSFVVYIRFSCISLYKLLEIPLLEISYGIPENVLNNFMEWLVIVNIHSSPHNPIPYGFENLGFTLFHSINSSYKKLFQFEVQGIFMGDAKIFFLSSKHYRK